MLLFSKLSPFYRVHMGQKEADMSKTISLAYTTAPAFSLLTQKAGKKPKLLPAKEKRASGASKLVC